MCVRLDQGQIAEMSPVLAAGPNEQVIDAKGGLLLPGLKDHHIHLLAYAASLESVACGPPDVNDAVELEAVLHRADGNGWIRGMNYHESVAGELDRWQLDELCSDRPIRIQHRSGKIWYLNSLALEHLQLKPDDHPGIEHLAGQLTGQLFRADDLLQQKLGRQLPDINLASARLAEMGICQITDTSPGNDSSTLSLFSQAQADGRLRQKVRLMGQANLEFDTSNLLEPGQHKILLDEYQLPELDELITRISTCHDQQRGVAFHCVTPVELTLALAALQSTGLHPDDRLEHVFECHDEHLGLISELGVTVVVQPGLVYTRGDQYLDDVGDLPHLHRLHSFLDADIQVAASSDAPYGDISPWLGITAAVNRTTRSGRAMGMAEAVDPETAITLYLGSTAKPHHPEAIAVGDPADLCLLSQPYDQTAEMPANTEVQATLLEGELIYARDS